MHKLAKVMMLVIAGSLIFAPVSRAAEATAAPAEQPVVVEPAAPPVETPAPTPALTPVATPAPAPAPAKPAIISNLPLQLYGYVRLDAAYDTAKVYPGNYVVYLPLPLINKMDDQLDITANQSRIGLKIMGPEFAGGKGEGKIEFDFYGGGAENKSGFMMRHAYYEVNWPGSQFGVLAGQTWDVISPLLPDTINFTACWMAGNVGYRRPQVRLSQNLALGNGSKLAAKLALARNIGRTNASDHIESGADAGVPVLEGSLAFQGKLFANQEALIGISGLRGREEYAPANANVYSVGVWAVSAELLLPLVDKLSLKAEAYRGSCLESYMGGIGLTGITAAKQGLNSQGAWASLGAGPFSGLKFNGGGSVDLPQFDQLANGTRSRNSVIFVNGFYDLLASLQVGAEISVWQTEYKNTETVKSVRYQVETTLSY